MQAAFMDMRLPTPSKWVPSDARPVRTLEQHKFSSRAFYARLKALGGMQRGGRMHAAAIRDALQTDDRNLPDYLRRLAQRGFLKREMLGKHYVYSLLDPTPNLRKEARAKAKKARIAKLRREIAKRELALQRLGA